MKREIKFRGQVIDEDTWVFGDLITHYEGEPDSIYIVDEDCCYWRVKPETVGQFIELQDKNVKDIYEGDKLKHPDQENWFPWLIGFNDGGFCLINIGVDGFLHEPMKITQNAVSEREIIGNIHESPDLLK